MRQSYPIIVNKRTPLQSLSHYFYQNWIYFAVFFAFSPSLFYVFLYHNDHLFWELYSHGTPHRELGHLILFGRPLGALLLHWQSILVSYWEAPELLNFFRLIAILLLMDMIRLLEAFLKDHLTLDSTSRFMILLLTFLQPSWLLGSAWAASIIPCILSYWLALRSSVLFFWSGHQRPSLRFFLASLLLTSAFLIYPLSTCVFFWPNLLLTTLASDERGLRELLRPLSLFFILGILAVALHFLFLKNYLCSDLFSCTTWVTIDSKEYSLKPPTSLLEKLRVLADILTLQARSWTLFFSKHENQPLHLLLAAVFPFASFLPLLSGKTPDFAPKIWLKSMGYFLLFVLLMNFPNLVTRGAVVVFRTLSPNSLMFSIGMVKIIHLIRKQQLRTSIFKLTLVYHLLMFFYVAQVFSSGLSRFLASSFNHKDWDHLCRLNDLNTKKAVDYANQREITWEINNFLPYDFGLWTSVETQCNLRKPTSLNKPPEPLQEAFD